MPEQSLSQTSIYSARPTLRVNGQEDERVSELLLAMVMEEAEGGMSTLELRFVNIAATGDGGTEPAFGAASALRLGAEIGVYAGDAASPREIFLGKVSALEMVCDFGSPPELVVLAEDALTLARRGRRSRIYDAMTPAGVVGAVAAELGLQAQVDGLTAPVATWARINETDLGFLRRLLARFDADLQVVGSRLQVAPRQDVRRGGIDLTLGNQLSRVRIIADLAHQATATTVTGWNAADGAAVRGEASTVSAAGPGRGKNGPDWAREVFGERSEHVGGLAVVSDAEAAAVSAAALDQRARRFVRAEGTAEGNAQLRVGCHVTLSRVSPQFDNTYYVVRARHLFDMRQGYRTEFEAECAFLGQ
ncbi:MAG TPA: contractile injection system protein, VgrG/Pvc8 family [Thiobacillaceae bacterium]|nr:contractile injection system protein, VgrG/Pvc8 family [Thiobacillaceae bacterium]HNU63042.1 contractile injection system protein, VgrG/Pvc8 family [Thiobacillaceae bacterium]